jgi:hypothetical protein
MLGEAKMTVSAQALEMRLKLRRLMLEHRVAPEPSTIPLTEPFDHPQVLEGYAATIDLDLDRTRLRPYAFGFPLPRSCRSVPLLFKHRVDQPAGRIADIDYDAQGNLVIRAEVTHEVARRCGGFSIAAKVLEYEVRDVETPSFYAVINSAELNELSITDRPSNPNALVMFRYRMSPKVQFLDLIGERVARLVQLTHLIKEARP